jgi:dihydroflavonol-4-reductase
VKGLVDAGITVHAAVHDPREAGKVVAAETTDIVDLGRRLLPAYGSRYALPRRALPKALAVALAPVAGLEREYLRRNIGFDLRVDNTRSRRALGVRYRPAQQSMEDMFEQLTERGR